MNDERPGFNFQSDAHAWASGLIFGALMARPELVVAPTLDESGTNFLPEARVSLGGRDFRLIIVELQ